MVQNVIDQTLAHETQIPLQDLNEEIVKDRLPVQGRLPKWLRDFTAQRTGKISFRQPTYFPLV